MHLVNLKLPLLVSRSEYPDLTSCYTALEAANEQLYQQFDMRAITRSELVSDISRYLTAIKEVAKLQREERPKIKLSAKSLLLAANEAFVDLRQQLGFLRVMRSLQAGECRARGEEDQTLFWRLWRR
ncbi:hypothetical protein FOZ62_006390, partial [Perkinsus olseni]